MKHCLRLESGMMLLVGVLAVSWAGVSYGWAQSLVTVVDFDTTNGANPHSGLITDAQGNLYGTTTIGGVSGRGTVFKISAATNVLTTLASFNNANGAFPRDRLIADAAGNLYGTTYFGGVSGTGVAFKLSAGTNALTRLASFSFASGSNPVGGLTVDADGNFYGATSTGGAGRGGTVFRLSAGTNEVSYLATFEGSTNSGPPGPYGALISDAAGNFYGSTRLGGANNLGTVFKFSPSSNALTTLATFNGVNGSQPAGTLIADPAGNLYGTTFYGGANDMGTVFKVSAGTNVLTTLATFDDLNGRHPFGGLISDAAGNLYGTTYLGGASFRGTVFKIDASTNALTTLATFNGSNGERVFAGLVADASGNLYGTTEGGGTNRVGTVFKLEGSGFVIPEPSSLGLLASGGLMMLRRGRRT